MAIPFSQTLRSLHSDSFGTSIAGMIAGLVLLCAWFFWFFKAQIPFYCLSLKASVTTDERISAVFPRDETRVRETREQQIIAEFSPEAAEDIRPGQSAWLYLDSGEIGKQNSPVPAKVKQVKRGDKKGQVLLSVLSDTASPIHIQRKASGQIKILAASLSPAQLVMKTAGFLTPADPENNTP